MCVEALFEHKIWKKSGKTSILHGSSVQNLRRKHKKYSAVSWTDAVC
jgi:hypothetical protein